MRNSNRTERKNMSRMAAIETCGTFQSTFERMKLFTKSSIRTLALEENTKTECIKSVKYAAASP